VKVEANHGTDQLAGHDVLGLMDAIQVERADFIGNSFGGGIALVVATRHPHRVRRLVLMGSVGVSFPITPGLEAVWGYDPSLTAMRRHIRPTLRYSWQKRDTSFECKHPETHLAYTDGGNHPSSTGRIIYIITLTSCTNASALRAGTHGCKRAHGARQRRSEPGESHY